MFKKCQDWDLNPEFVNEQDFQSCSTNLINQNKNYENSQIFGQEKSYTQYSDCIQTTNFLVENEKKVEKVYTFTLKSIYFEYKDELKVFLLDKLNKGYAMSVVNTLKRLFENYNVNSIKDIKQLMINKTIAKKSASVSIRVFLNYIEENDLLDIDDIDKFRRQVKVQVKSGVDKYIPNDNEIITSLKNLKNTFEIEAYLVYLFLIQTSCRYSEVKDFFTNYESKHLEIRNNICIYSNFYIRGKKSSFYLIFTTKLYDKLKLVMKNITEKKINGLLRRLQGDKNIINVKYLRKYSFSLMVMNEIPIQVADMISGRSQKSNIGITHYLNQKEIMAKEYQKVVKKFEELM